MTHSKELADGSVLCIAPAKADEAQALIDYLEAVTAESDMLAAGAGEMQLSVADEVGFVESMAAADNSVLLRGMVGGEIVAVASLTGGRYKRSRHTAELGISVKRGFWRLGVGAAMMDALLAFARGTGVLTHIHLAVRSDNARAIYLYQRFGFALCGRFPGAMQFGGQLYSNSIMALALYSEAAPRAEGITVREAVSGDLPALLALYGQLHPGEAMPDITPELQSHWGRILYDENQHTILVCVGGAPVAACSLVIIPGLPRRRRPYALVENVVTDAALRRKGYGHMALARAREIAIGHNCYKLMLMTSNKDAGTLAFYRKAGFDSNDKTAFVMRFGSPTANR